MVQNNQKKVDFYAVLGHLGTPKYTQKGTQRPAALQVDEIYVPIN
jgi:hypothetical protein